jgi:1-deoxy-D-xylulose-5-phosphate reductoisomerase
MVDMEGKEVAVGSSVDKESLLDGSGARQDGSAVERGTWPRRVSIVGSTGSIGRQAIDVVASAPEEFQVVALAARSDLDKVLQQARRFSPALVVLVDEGAAKAARELLPRHIEVLSGQEGLIAAASEGDVVLNAVVGFAGLPVTMRALQSGKILALANKESMVAGAGIVQQARVTPGASIVPVDSEHCAIHQCLASTGVLQENFSSLRRIVLTASGGPFRSRSLEELQSVTVEDALNHPTWNMGAKITVDSSTLMNKGLEVIEAHELFHVDYEKIEVVIHPQSVVHSMVETTDGAMLAQLSMPDMRLPIGYALSFPKRLPTPFGALDFAHGLDLHFEVPDMSKWRCLAIAFQAGRAGGLMPAWLNAANEVAVEAFLERRLSWLAIPEVLEEVLERADGLRMSHPPARIEDVLDADAQAREVAKEAVAKRGMARAAL